MSRKLALIAQQPGVTVLHIAPRNWQDDLLKRDLSSSQSAQLSQQAVWIHRPADPHRAVYHTLSFEMTTFRPDIIHAEEEPDSIPALQIAVARRLFAPHARLIYHTWQNVSRPMAAPVRWVMRATLSASDAILCANHEGMALLKSAGYNKPTQVIPPIGVDTSVFRPADQTQAAEADRSIILYMGRPQQAIVQPAT